MLEGTLSKNCKDYFKSLGSCCKAIKKHQGAYTSQKGISDWLICYKGRFIAMELKIGDNTTSDLQEEFLVEIDEAGGVRAVCYFLDEVKEVIRKIEAENELHF